MTDRPGDPTRRAALEAVAVAALEAGDPALTARAARSLLQLGLEAAEPDKAAWLRAMGDAEDLLGRALMAQGRITAAEAALAEALACRLRICHDWPDRLSAAGDLVLALWRMAELEAARGDVVAERVWAGQARDQLAGLAARWPGEPTVEAFLAGLQDRLAGPQDGLAGPAPQGDTGPAACRDVGQADEGAVRLASHGGRPAPGPRTVREGAPEASPP